MGCVTGFDWMGRGGITIGGLGSGLVPPKKLLKSSNFWGGRLFWTGGTFVRGVSLLGLTGAGETLTASFLAITGVGTLTLGAVWPPPPSEGLGSGLFSGCLGSGGFGLL